MSEPSDEALVANIQSGDIFAFEVLVKRYQRKLRGYVYHMLHDDQSAQDVVQESFINLYKTIDRIDSAKKFSSYVYAIARNTAISHMRKWHKTVSLDDVELVDQDQWLYDVLDQKEQSENVHTALNHLGHKYRRVIELYYFGDLSYEQISETMRLPVNTVRTHLRRAKGLLRKELEQ